VDVLTARDWRFRKFVLEHLGDHMPAHEASEIEVLARTRCPAAARELCADILSQLGGDPIVEP
jgi:hypothetical protein